MTRTQRFKTVSTGVVCLSLLTACAQRPDQISPSYISPIAYSPSTCSKLEAERIDVVAMLDGLTEEQTKNADRDAVAMGVGLFLFWPALLALAMTDDQKAEIANTKGNLEAIDQTMEEKNC